MNEQYHRFNESLMNNINAYAETPPAAQTASVSTLSSGGDYTETSENTGTGWLIVVVSLARGAIPVEGAKVTVTKSDGDMALAAELFTDNSGRTEKLALPAPMAKYSQTPGGSMRPYSIYDIAVEKEGYYPEKAINVPIFDNNVSIQPMALIPLSETSVPENQLIIDESSEQIL